MKIPGVPVSRRLLNSSIIIAFFSAGILFSQEPPVPPPAKGKAKDNKLEQKAAGQNAQKADAPKIKDYSAGFEKFYKLGLPDVSNAKYVKLDVYSNYGPSSMLSYQLRAMGIKGNAWQLKEDKAGKNVFERELLGLEMGMCIGCDSQFPIEEVLSYHVAAALFDY